MRARLGARYRAPKSIFMLFLRFSLLCEPNYLSLLTKHKLLVAEIDKVMPQLCVHDQISFHCGIPQACFDGHGITFGGILAELELPEDRNGAQITNVSRVNMSRIWVKIHYLAQNAS